MGQVISLERIKREARKAAQQGVGVDVHCPYPLDTDAGGAFVWYYEEAVRELAEGKKEAVA